MLCLVAFGNESVRKFTVVLDAGHGGVDPGAVGKIAKEKDINLSVVKTLGEKIKIAHPEVKVLYTRTEDVFLPLNARSYIMDKDTADLFISIHSNYSKNKEARGVETFILGNNKTEENLEVAMRENSVIRLENDYATHYQGFDPNSSESYIIFELTQNQYIHQSRQIANYIQQQFSSIYQRVNREVKEAGFWVLLKSACPSVLIELGFLSNLEEEKFLASDEGVKQSSQAIADAFTLYYNKYRIDRHNDSEEELIDTSKPPKKNYAVQIFTSHHILHSNDPAFKGLKNCRYIFKDGWYKYYYGETPDKKEIRKTRSKLKSELFPDCFIIEL